MVTAPDQRQLLSIVVPCYNEEESFPALRAALTSVAAELEKEVLRVELVFVDDGSRDGIVVINAVIHICGVQLQ